MPRYAAEVCPDCSSTLAAGGQVSITTTDTGLTCAHTSPVSYDLKSAINEVSGEATMCLLTIVEIRPQNMQPVIRTVHLTQADLDAMRDQRPGFGPAEWLKACAHIDLEAIYGDVEFGKPDGDSPQVKPITELAAEREGTAKKLGLTLEQYLHWLGVR